MTDKMPAAERNQERIKALHEFAVEPRELYADVAVFTEDHGVLRIRFDVTRPEAEDELSWPHIPVSRIAIPLALFRHYFDTWTREREAAIPRRTK